MILTINELMQSDSDNIRAIAHILYEADAEQNGLNPGQVDKIAKLLLDLEKDDLEKMKESSYNDGYKDGRDDGYGEGYDEGRHED